MSEPNEESLYEALNKGDLSAFVSLVEAGVRVTSREENISRLFFCLEDVRDPKILPVIDRLSLDLRRYGGKPPPAGGAGSALSVREPATTMRAITSR